jgi:hypothetical protein
MSDVTTDDVREAFSHLSTAETETSDLAGGIRVAASDSEAGQFFKTLRTNGFDYTAKRLGDSLVANIEAEESRGLGDLFA